MRIDIAWAGRRVDAMVADGGRLDPRQLVDAEVRVRGVCEYVMNDRRQVVGMRLLATDASAVRIDAPAADPASIPLTSIAALADVAIRQHPHRVRVRGIVTMQRPGIAVFIRDESGPIFVETASKVSLVPGDRVEVVGFVSNNDVPELNDAVIRRFGAGSPPRALPVTPDEAKSGELEDELIELEATLLARSTGPDEHTLTLQAGALPIAATLEGPNAERAFRRLRPGSRLRVTGICIPFADGAGRRMFRMRPHAEG